MASSQPGQHSTSTNSANIIVRIASIDILLSPVAHASMAVHAGASAAGSTHAHPCPAPFRSASADNLRDFFADAVEIYLQDLPGARRSTVTDIFYPDVRRAPFSTKFHVNHLDVVSC